MVCTIYSHEIGYDLIVEELRSQFPKGVLKFEEIDEHKVIYLTIKGGLFKPKKVLRINYRERKNPSFQFTDDDCSLTGNLKGLYSFVNSIQSNNETVKELFLKKITTLNCEFSIIAEPKLTNEFETFIRSISKKLEGVLFVQPDNNISKASEQHFLDKNLNLLLDRNGNCEVDHLQVNIKSKYFDSVNSEITKEQIDRKERSLSLIKSKNIKVAEFLPVIESENKVKIRSKKEIAERVAILSVTNAVAFNQISGEQAKNYLSKLDLLNLVSPKEMIFLENPTEDLKNNETWRSECIWVLMWALKIVDSLDFPNKMVDLGEISSDQYPLGQNRTLLDFINSDKELRSKIEILDANDLYYRINWACVDARLKGNELTEVILGVVYERQYALNWLINYGDAEWDDVTCDT